MHLLTSRAVLATALFLLAVPLRSAGQASSPAMDYTQPGLTLREVTTHMRSTAPADDTGEGGERNEADVFEALWTQRVHHNDSSGSSMFRKYWNAASADAAAKSIGGCAPGGPAFRGTWECIGPKSYPNTQRIGYINSVWADPADPTANTVLAGTPGGLFKTTNGGASWTCLTDAAAISHGTTSITSIAVHPTRNDTIYLGTASASMLFTYDGGVTWSVEVIPPSAGATLTFDDFRKGIARVVFSPDASRLYVLRGREIWCRAYPSGSWVEITPPIAPASVLVYTELKFAPGSSTAFMATANGDNFVGGEAGRIMHGAYTGFGMTHAWASITDGINAAGPPTGVLNLTAPYIYEVHCSYRDANRLLVQITVFDTFRKLAPAWAVDNFFHYDIPTGAWSYVRGINDLPSGCGGGCRGLTSSEANPDVIYIKGGVPYITIDGGQTICSLGTYWCEPTHGDIRGIWVQKATASDSAKDDVVFFATDGGVSRKPGGQKPAGVERIEQREHQPERADDPSIL